MPSMPSKLSVATVCGSGLGDTLKSGISTARSRVMKRRRRPEIQFHTLTVSYFHTCYNNSVTMVSGVVI